MAVRLYLHIGHPQTGTTALQSFFSQNALALAAAGLLYPQTGRLSTAHYLFSFALGLGHWDEGEVAAPEILGEQLKREIAASSCDRVLLSSEYFALAGPAQIARVKTLFADYDARILIYLRRHDYALEAGYAQSAKTTAAPPWQPNVESFVLYQLTANLKQYDYLACLRRWAAAFGPEAVIVRPYEAVQNQPDLFGDFLRAIEVDDRAALIRPGALNVSLNPPFTAALTSINRAAIPEKTKRLLRAAIIRLGGRQQAKEPYLSSTMRHAIVQRFAPSYGVIATEFLGRTDGVLFREPPPEGAPSADAPREPTSEEVLAVILEAMALYLG